MICHPWFIPAGLGLIGFRSAASCARQICNTRVKLIRPLVVIITVMVGVMVMVIMIRMISVVMF